MNYNPVKLTYENIVNMRALHLHNPRVYNGPKLAKMFKCSTANAQKVLSGRVWKYIEFPIQPYASERALAYIRINEQTKHLPVFLKPQAD